MSQLKKQTVAGRKSAKRSKQVASHSQKGSSGILRKVGRSVVQLSKAVFVVLRPGLYAVRRWPLATVAFVVGGGVFLGVGYGISRLTTSLTQSLPTSIEVNSPRPELNDTIIRISSDTLQTARNEKWSRNALADKLLSRVSMVDGVDEVSLRTGLDRKLRVDVVAQAPLLVMEAKGGERILVGSKFKIIARGLGADSYTNLPMLEAPDLSLNVHSARERRRENSGLFVRPSTVSSANVRWLGQQTLKIDSLFSASKIPAKIEKILWRNGSGFSIVISSKDHSAADHPASNTISAVPVGTTAIPTGSDVSSMNQRTTVVLGENQFNEKFERLAHIVQDLRQRKVSAEQIDLGFSDKAIIRMPETLSDAKRGGFQ
ncbi:MAG: hypothetical protein RI953_1014 [Pseudomonadota bacterium]|jgi:hypothetical protein